MAPSPISTPFRRRPRRVSVLESSASSRWCTDSDIGLPSVGPAWHREAVFPHAWSWPCHLRAAQPLGSGGVTKDVARFVPRASQPRDLPRKLSESAISNDHLYFPALARSAGWPHPPKNTTVHPTCVILT